MKGAFRAEWLKTTRRPVVWILLSILLGVLAFFVYLPGWWFFAHGPQGLLPAGTDLHQLIDEYYPRQIIPHFLSTMPGLMGAACLTLGVISLGSDYAWGTLHTITSLPPGRLASLAGRLTVLAAVILALDLFLWAVAAALAWTFAAIDRASLAAPPLQQLVGAIGTTWLVCSMWCSFGVVLAAAFRQQAVPLAIGLLYLLVIEGLVFNLLGSIGGEGIRDLEKLLPGPNAGALIQAFGHGYVPAGIQAPTPLVAAWQAVTAVAAYLLLFCAGTAYLVQRRDLS
ncbi:MAG TPA: ABC transporter permease [Candidatus Dormibacteraeota bacterium]|nr:ABC transporter permease [Candidatus Dormibacteraeota bacterium]